MEHSVSIENKKIIDVGLAIKIGEIDLTVSAIFNDIINCLLISVKPILGGFFYHVIEIKIGVVNKRKKIR